MQNLAETEHRQSEIKDFAVIQRRLPSSAIALSIFAVFFVAFNYLVQNHKCSYWIKRNSYQQLKQNLECVVTGNSHAFYGISPERLGCEAMSFANVAQSLGTDCALIEKCLNECPALKLVVINISYHSLGYSVLAEVGQSSWRDCYSFQYYGVSEADNWKRIQDLKYFVPSYLIGTERCKKIIRHRLKDPGAAVVDESNWVTKRGWAQVWTVPNLTDELGLKHVAFHDKLNQEYYRKVNLANLETLLKDCKAKNVSVLFLSPPAWKTYRKYINRTEWGKTQAEIERLCKTYGASYANYLEDPRFKVEDFYDDNHLIVGGAMKFSEFLRQEQIGPIMANFRIRKILG